MHAGHPADDAPIVIVPYDDAWPRLFADEAHVLRATLGAWLAGPIEHVGSTAIRGLAAKPVVDIMAGIHSLDTARPAIDAAAALDYCHAPYRADQEHWFCKPSFADRRFHLHLVPIDSADWRATLAFRDFLRAHPLVSAEYEGLKRQLAREHRTNREAYTEAKHPFIARVTGRALDEGYGQSNATS
jgi:GrpB-like predicted nucleotidyltransferase (UPF0157 family)